MPPRKSRTTGHVFKKINKDSGPSQLANKLRGEAEQQPMRSAQTLGRMLNDFNMTMEVTCLACAHKERLAPDALRAAHDMELPLADLRIPCPACGSNQTSLMPLSA